MGLDNKAVENPLGKFIIEKPLLVLLVKKKYYSHSIHGGGGGGSGMQHPS